jgi:hypothetical protein
LRQQLEKKWPLGLLLLVTATLQEQGGVVVISSRCTARKGKDDSTKGEKWCQIKNALF